MGRISGDSLILTLYLAISLLVGLDLREYVRAVVASRLHDPTPRLWGRLSLNPRVWFEPFGSGLLPALILALWAAVTLLPPVIAYAKPPPIDPNYFRRYRRDSVIVGLAGPVANLVVAIGAGLVLRIGLPSRAQEAIGAFMFVNLCLVFFHLLPIPGLDGARLVGLVLPPRAAEVYRNADAYLPLFVLIVIFLLVGPVNTIVHGLSNAVCQAASGNSCLLWMAA